MCLGKEGGGCRLGEATVRILLCVPRSPFDPKVKPADLALYPPLGLGYLATYLRHAGHEVALLDNSVRRYSVEPFKKAVADFAPDLVGFTAYTVTVNAALALAKCVKEVSGRIQVVLGGCHPTCLPKETLAHDQVDMVVVGEGEETLCEVAAALSSGGELDGIEGLWYKKDGAIRQNPSRSYIEDIDAIPLPSYDLMELGRYCQGATRRIAGRKLGTVITGRGCPYQCTFCSKEHLGPKARLRSAANVVDEVEHLVRRHGIEEIMFVDDTFTLDRNRAMAICALMVERGLKAPWTCNTRADDASDELYAVMAQAGCRSFLLGAEAGTQEMLDSMKKGITLAQTENAVRLAKKHGIDTICSFVFGMPGDTAEKAAATVRFARKLDPTFVSFTTACPLPGSELFEWAVREGRLDPATADWGIFSFFSPAVPVIAMSALSRQDLIRINKAAHRAFYMRPQYIWRRLIRLRSFSGLVDTARAFFANLGYAFTKTS